MKRREWIKPSNLYDARAAFLIDREWPRLLPRLAEARRALDLRLIGRRCIDIGVERGRQEKEAAQNHRRGWERTARAFAKAERSLAEARLTCVGEGVSADEPEAEHWMPTIRQLAVQRNATLGGAERLRIPELLQVSDRTAEALAHAERSLAGYGEIARSMRDSIVPRSGNPGDLEKRGFVHSFVEAWTYLTGALPSGEKEERLNPFLPLLAAAWTDLGFEKELVVAADYPFARALEWAREACGPLEGALAGNGPSWLGTLYWDGGAAGAPGERFPR